jgi:hypothetical protein
VKEYTSHLRDLAHKIREVARDHIARSQVVDLMNHIDDHLNALALIEENNRREHMKAQPLCDCAADRAGSSPGQQ